ncbi:IS110 family transposase [Nonomuraea sp. NPDC004702]
MTSITPDTATIADITGGVDTHQDTHTAAVLDEVGRVLGTEQFRATPAGYTAPLAWMRALGYLNRIGVEGTGVYGAGLTRLLQARVHRRERDRPA